MNACSALAEAQAKPFGYVVFRDGHEIAIGHLYVDHVAAKAAAMQIAQLDGAQGRGGRRRRAFVLTILTVGFFVAVRRYLVQGWGAGGVKG